jgi:hypothetical protein
VDEAALGSLGGGGFGVAWMRNDWVWVGLRRWDFSGLVLKWVSRWKRPWRWFTLTFYSLCQ